LESIAKIWHFECFISMSIIPFDPLFEFFVLEPIWTESLQKLSQIFNVDNTSTMHKPMRLGFDHVDVPEYVENRKVMLGGESLLHRFSLVYCLYFTVEYIDYSVFNIIIHFLCRWSIGEMFHLIRFSFLVCVALWSNNRHKISQT
jgi:hypothetical protein